MGRTKPGCPRLWAANAGEISDELTKADKLIKVGIAEDHPLAQPDLVDLLGTRQDPVVAGRAPNGEGAPVSVEPMVRFGRLDPEWVGRLSRVGLDNAAGNERVDSSQDEDSGRG